jgi:hypothetical protein
MTNFDFLLSSPDFASFGEAAATARKFRAVQPGGGKTENEYFLFNSRFFRYNGNSSGKLEDQPYEKLCDHAPGQARRHPAR